MGGYGLWASKVRRSLRNNERVRGLVPDPPLAPPGAASRSVPDGERHPDQERPAVAAAHRPAQAGVQLDPADGRPEAAGALGGGRQLHPQDRAGHEVGRLRALAGTCAGRPRALTPPRAPLRFGTERRD